MAPEAPVAPDAPWGPYGAVNPQSLTRLVVVLMFLNGLAHMAQRVVGPRHGLAITGFVGGFVSSSATIAALGMKAREQPERWRSAVAGANAFSQFLARTITSVSWIWPSYTCNPPGLRPREEAINR